MYNEFVLFMGRQRGVSDSMVGEIHTAACTHLPTTARGDFFRALSKLNFLS